jgi:hypothetical protein
MSPSGREGDFVFNVVITPGTFRYLQLFTRSLIANSEARFRLVVNGCPAHELAGMHALAAAHDGRVEVVPLSSPTMVPHGAALDEIYAARDDGDYFCFMDSDVKAKRPFMGVFAELLDRFDAVTSGNIAWSDDAVLPAGSPDLVGRHAVGHDGFVYGSSYLAIYRRAAAERVREQWGVTFRAGAHAQLPGPVQQRLVEMNRRFELYDTAKAFNILLQGEGFALTHVDNPALVHIGGISQYLSDPTVLARGSAPEELEGGDSTRPWFAASGAGRDRWDFARWAAALLRSIVDGEAAPQLPELPVARERAMAVQRELLDLVGH